MLQTHDPARKRWSILVVAYLCNMIFALIFQSVPPLLNLIMDEMNLSYAQGGLLMSFFALPGIIVSIPAGLLADRYNQKTIGLTSLGLVIIGQAIFIFAGSFPALALGRTISGIGCMTLSVIAPQFLGQWFGGREMGRAMGIFNTSMPIGTILSLNLLSLLGQNFGWRTSIWLTVALAFGVVLVFIFLYAAPAVLEKSGTRESFFGGMRQIGVPIWILSAGWAVFNGSILAFFTFTPDLLKAGGFSIASAGFIVSLAMLPGLVSSPVIGYVIDRFDRKITIIMLATAVTALMLAFIPGALNFSTTLIILIGICTNVVPTSTFALVSEVSGAQRQGLGFGIAATCLNIGIFIVPALAGFTRDITGSYPGSYLLMAGVMLLTTVALAVLGLIRIRRQKLQPDN